MSIINRVLIAFVISTSFILSQAAALTISAQPIFSASINANQFKPYGQSHEIPLGTYQPQVSGMFELVCQVTTPSWNDHCQQVNLNITSNSGNFFSGPAFTTTCKLPPCHQLICPISNTTVLTKRILMYEHSNPILTIHATPLSTSSPIEPKTPTQDISFSCHVET